MPKVLALLWNLCFASFSIRGKSMPPKQTIIKERALGATGSMENTMWVIFEDSKNRWFFDIDLGLRKIFKNQSLEHPWIARRTSVQGLWGPRAAANYQINRWIDNKNHEVQDLTHGWPGDFSSKTNILENWTFPEIPKIIPPKCSVRKLLTLLVHFSKMFEKCRQSFLNHVPI